RYGIEARFERYPYPKLTAGSPAHIAALFGTLPVTGESAETDRRMDALPLMVGPLTLWHQARDWFDLHGYYFLSPIQNSQAALALFAGGVAAPSPARGARKRCRHSRAR